MFAQSSVRLAALALAAGAALSLGAPEALADRKGGGDGGRGSSSGLIGHRGGDYGGGHSSRGHSGRSHSSHGHNSHHSGSKIGFGIGFNFGGGDCNDSWGVGVGYSSGWSNRSRWGYNDCYPRVRTYTRYNYAYCPPVTRTYVVQQPIVPPPTVVVIDQGRRSDADSQPSVAPVVVKPVYTVDPRELQRGWALLSDGEAERAQRVFSSLAQLSENGQAKAGFALASAILRDDATAAWAMRRAYFFGSSDLMHIPVDRAMRARIDALAERYADRVAVNGPDRDMLFLLASLDHLRGGRAAALHQIDRAIAAGDDSQSAQILRSLVGGATTPQSAPMYGAPMQDNAGEAPLYGPATTPAPAGAQPATGSGGPTASR